MTEKKEISDRQKRFCREYLIDYNATQAAIRAGYKENSARQHASRMLSNDDIRAFIMGLQDRQTRRLEVSADRVIMELSHVAFSDPADFYDKSGALLDIHLVPEDARKSLAGVEVYEEFMGAGDDRHKIGETKKVKRWDKVRALEILGKHLKLWTERHEVSGPKGGPIQTESKVTVERYEDAVKRIRSEQLGQSLAVQSGLQLQDRGQVSPNGSPNPERLPASDGQALGRAGEGQDPGTNNSP
jgi:phage terminase small subunit